MLCDKCKKNEACYHSTLIVNGNSQSTHLCSECAKKEGLLNNEPMEIFDSFINDFTDFGIMDMLDDFFCPSCNRNFNDYKINGYLGCPDCFDIFKKDMEDLETKFGSKYNYNEKTDNDSIEFRTPKKSKEEQEIDNLQQQLNSAIQDERYEDAADINKRLKTLKNKNDK